MSEKAATPVVPGEGASDPERRGWLRTIFSVPDGWELGEVVRYGATARTPLTIELLPPGGGDPRVVQFDEEEDAARPGSLRMALGRAGLRAAWIANAKIAGDVYYVLCKLAKVIGGQHPLDELREQIDGYRLEARPEPHSFRKGYLYGTLAALRAWPYSKRQINLWLAALERGADVDPPVPPLFVDDEGGEWTSVTHLATYIRWGRDQPGVISNEALAGRVVQLGGTRWRARAWDATTRERQNQIAIVLIRLPAVDSEPSEDERV